jgi:hypothetical protein
MELLIFGLQGTVVEGALEALLGAYDEAELRQIRDGLSEYLEWSGDRGK